MQKDLHDYYNRIENKILFPTLSEARKHESFKNEKERRKKGNGSLMSLQATTG